MFSIKKKGGGRNHWGGDGKERIDMLSLVMMDLFSWRDKKSSSFNRCPAVVNMHKLLMKKKRKVSMLGKKYLLTRCHKTFKFLSYLYPEEAEIPLLDKNKNCLGDSLCYTIHARKASVPYLFFAPDLYQRQREQFLLKKRILKKIAVKYIWLFQEQNK